MTKEQALKDMQERCRICKENTFPTEDDCEDCYFPPAIEALEKQIPKKPDESYDGYADEFPVIDYSCPCCGREIDYTDHHCICGQLIQWNTMFCENCMNAKWNSVENSRFKEFLEWDYSSICEKCTRKNPEAMYDLWKEVEND